MSAPASGHFVACQTGYMIPYTQRIPGTDVTIEMMPVPGADGIAPFWIGKYEITFGQYKPFMDLEGSFRQFQNLCVKDINEANKTDVVTAPTQLYDPVCHFGEVVGEDGSFPGLNYPAMSMSRFAARQYTKWLSLISSRQFRLPTELEWEHACRAGTKTKWSFGANPKMAGEFCVYLENSPPEGPAKVGSKKPNRWGIYDMHGNVAEWAVQPKYLVNKVDREGMPDADWREASSRDRRLMIFKGGDWTKEIEDCRSSIREHATDELWEIDYEYPNSPHWLTPSGSCRIGFRIVCPMESMPRDEIEKYWSTDSRTVQFSVEYQNVNGRAAFGVVDPTLPAAHAEHAKKKR